MPEPWTFMYYIDPIPKSLLPLAIQQFYCPLDDPTCPKIESTRLGGTVSKWEYVKTILATNENFEGVSLSRTTKKSHAPVCGRSASHRCSESE